MPCWGASEERWIFLECEMLREKGVRNVALSTWLHAMMPSRPFVDDYDFLSAVSSTEEEAAAQISAHDLFFQPSCLSLVQLISPFSSVFFFPFFPFHPRVQTAKRPQHLRCCANIDASPDGNRIVRRQGRTWRNTREGTPPWKTGFFRLPYFFFSFFFFFLRLRRIADQNILSFYWLFLASERKKKKKKCLEGQREKKRGKEGVW